MLLFRKIINHTNYRTTYHFSYIVLHVILYTNTCHFAYIELHVILVCVYKTTYHFFCIYELHIIFTLIDCILFCVLRKSQGNKKKCIFIQSYFDITKITITRNYVPFLVELRDIKILKRPLNL